MSESCFGSTDGSPTSPSCTNNGYGTYPAWSKNALGQVTFFSYDLALGQITAETDPNGNTTGYSLNGNTTGYSLDAAGRLMKMARPGDDLSAPTFQIMYQNYASSAAPFAATGTQKVSADASRSVTQFYNGFGELIQTRTSNQALKDAGCAAANAVCDVVVDYQGGYQNAALPPSASRTARVDGKTALYAMPLGSAYAVDASKQFWTKMVYRVDGQIEGVSAPDGTYPLRSDY